MAENGGFISGDSPIVNLIIGEYYTENKTLAENQDLSIGAVLGEITVGGEVVLSDDGATDGSEDPSFILLKDATTGAGETLEVPVMTFGRVDKNELSYGGAHDEDSVKKPLRQLGIYLQESSPA